VNGMATVAGLETFAADETLVKAITSGVADCLMMCDTSARCVGVSTVPMRDPGRVTGMIGVHGDVSGFITVNMAEQVAMTAVAGLLQEQFETLNGQVIDGVGEITNIISGGIKNKLAKTPWAFSHVTVPSVIVGQNYQIAYAKGLEFLSAAFEHADDDALLLADRLLQVSISLIRL
jgi:CheY-specific phosphatase CheX